MQKLPVVPICRTGHYCGKSESMPYPAPSRTRQEGRCAASGTLSAGCDGRNGSLDVAMSMRTAKACGPGTPGLVPSLRDKSLAGDGDYKVTDTGESAQISVKTVAQGRPDCFGVPVVNLLVCSLFHSMRGCGCTKHPAFPAPSVFEGQGRRTTRARISAARMPAFVFRSLTCIRIATSAPRASTSLESGRVRAVSARAAGFSTRAPRAARRGRRRPNKSSVSALIHFGRAPLCRRSGSRSSMWARSWAGRRIEAFGLASSSG
jgi:hypothetical protein